MAAGHKPTKGDKEQFNRDYAEIVEKARAEEAKKQVELNKQIFLVLYPGQQQVYFFNKLVGTKPFIFDESQKEKAPNDGHPFSSSSPRK